MPEVSFFSQTSSELGKMSLKDSIFAAPVNQDILHESVLNYLANRRRGTSSTKTRGEVSGGGKKPWKQKGTGRARQGSTRAPHWMHGGITFGPKPRDYSYALPSKIRVRSLCSALSAKQSDGSLIVVEPLNINTVKTKQIFSFLKNFKVEGTKVLLVVDKMDEKIKKSCRNIEKLVLSPADSIHPYQLLWADKVFITKPAVAKLEEVLA